jgi:hypothetical protein
MLVLSRESVKISGSAHNGLEEVCVSGNRRFVAVLLSSPPVVYLLLRVSDCFDEVFVLFCSFFGCVHP